MGALTTHVLDTSTGRPGADILVRCVRNAAGGILESFPDVRTDADGRAVVVDAGAMTKGIYELTFLVADYFAGRGLGLPDPPFLDRVTLRFGIADPAAKTHVPLLVSPWSYATYRGT